MHASALRLRDSPRDSRPQRPKALGADTGRLIALFATTTAVLSLNQLDNVTTRGRDVMNLLRTLPGVTTVAVQPWGGGEMNERDPSGTQSNGGQFGSFTPAIGGARLFWNTVTVDGQVGSNPDFPGLFMAAISMDAVSEAKIVSNNYSADYGHNSGSTINLVSKSGAQDFHGTFD